MATLRQNASDDEASLSDSDFSDAVRCCASARHSPLRLDAKLA